MFISSMTAVCAFRLSKKRREGGLKKCYEASLSGCCAIIVVL